MKAKRLLISSELFLSLFSLGQHPGYTVIEGAIPEDARVMDVQDAVRHGWPSAIELLIESEFFEEVGAGELIPQLIMAGAISASAQA